LEVRQKFENCGRKGGTEVETMSQTPCKERERHSTLPSALEEILRGASAGLDGEKKRFNKPADLLQWRKPVQ
jgi:hypothetical protein